MIKDKILLLSAVILAFFIISLTLKHFRARSIPKSESSTTNTIDQNSLFSSKSNNLHSIAALQNTHNSLTKKEKLFSAAKKAQIKIVLQIIDQGIEINCSDSNGKTLLMYACDGLETELSNSDTVLKAKQLKEFRKQKEALCRLLLKRGANVNSIDSTGSSALIYAAKWGYNDICFLLINKGAKINVVDKDGFTVLHHAVLRGRKREFIDSLIKMGADTSIRNHDGKTAFELIVPNR